MNTPNQDAPVAQENQLIPVFTGIIGGEQQHVCDAKSLYSFLSIQTRFNDWINRRIEEYQFIENQDFALISQNWEIKGRGGDRRAKIYHLTLDMAKELSMVENNEQGRKARRYFIAMEKAALHTSATEPERLRELIRGELANALPKTAHLPQEQAQAITDRLLRLYQLFHPHSTQASDALGVLRALSGLHPNLGVRQPGWQIVIEPSKESKK